MAIVEYSDLDCSACATFALNVLPAVDQAYITPGHVLLAFRNFPDVQLRPHAMKAAELAMCAGRQGKFWEVHDLFFRNQGRASDVESVNLARTAVGSVAEFDSCAAGQATGAVLQDAGSALAYGLSGTPTLFIGRLLADGRVKVVHRLNGSPPYAVLAEILDELLRH